MAQKYSETALTILTAAEKQLQTLIQTAAIDGDYHAVGEIVALARGIEQLRIAAPLGGPRAENGGEGRIGEGRIEEPTPKPHQTSSNRKTRNYPYFLRERDLLVKVGWSKTNRTEYEHKAPKLVVDLLVERVTEQSSRNNRFSTERLFPLKARDGSAIPDYQSYLSLAWLCAAGAVEREGRQGYRVIKKPLSRFIDNAWSEIGER